MAVAAMSFQWLDTLEKDFDVAFVDLDTILGSGILDSLEEAGDMPPELDEAPGGLTGAVRHKLAAMASCWAQLVHKAQTVFQNNAKLEAALVQARDELQQAEAARRVAEKEMRDQLLQLHAAQLQLHKHTAAAAADSDTIMKKLDSDLYLRRRDLLREEKMVSELQRLRSEVDQLNAYIVSLQSEVVGCRLAAKYMDKELAGRIQQIQLLGRGLHGPEHDRLWAQLEAEIQLHRHKTLIRACRSRSWRDPPPEPAVSGSRLVTVTKADKEGLGMSITGGDDHGVPIVVSALKPSGPAARSGQVHVGDTILSVNGISLQQVRHDEAVEVLSSVTGDIRLELLYLPTLPEDVSEGIYDMERFRYSMSDEEALVTPVTRPAPAGPPPVPLARSTPVRRPGVATRRLPEPSAAPDGPQEVSGSGSPDGSGPSPPPPGPVSNGGASPSVPAAPLTNGVPPTRPATLDQQLVPCREV
ncbi:Golgi-associated PDZ and coiled-coil motif-containing protein-like [Amphibalanus amphitrite]|uniref:Golgi-associated PDZ and coiled-coil motif-containing protein-like n=1 Tax=Amphibalanus amphitrite TaxID=1232801 RepID=UPI001C911D65|nr:Golgi-associated PDZ and coiled-coil motif-containing protein-like [Amphibalanus amphitrite]XP_043245822.1 Golgi-associated PDZ and coiled-coil motif-containing protein-like [Amphibalanus amphitrite]